MKYQADILIDHYLGGTRLVRSKRFRTMFMARIWAKYAAVMVDWFYPTHPDNGVRWGIFKL
jgi:hypothetical protein